MRCDRRVALPASPAQHNPRVPIRPIGICVQYTNHLRLSPSHRSEFIRCCLPDPSGFQQGSTAISRQWWLFIALDDLHGLSEKSFILAWGRVISIFDCRPGFGPAGSIH
jgi:hypothetical protein